MSSATEALVAIIGGSGLCRQEMFPVIQRIRPCTDHGEPSDDIQICAYVDATGNERRLAFLPRHGIEHSLAPHKIPYRANIKALHDLGVAQIVATCIAGSLRPRIRPGDLVVPDQFVDLTSGRDPGGPPTLIHLPMADPYCPRLRALCRAEGRRAGLRTHGRGTVAVIQGPRFSTKAESRWFSRQGWELVNMTQYPECYLAREAGICYAVLAMITDYDVGVDRRGARISTGTSVEPVLSVFRDNVDALKRLLPAVLTSLPIAGPCDCGRPFPPEYYKRTGGS